MFARLTVLALALVTLGGCYVAPVAPRPYYGYGYYAPAPVYRPYYGGWGHYGGWGGGWGRGGYYRRW